MRNLMICTADCVMGEWRKLYNEEFIDLYYSPNIVSMTESRRMRGAGHVAPNAERGGLYSVLVG